MTSTSQTKRKPNPVSVIQYRREELDEWGVKASAFRRGEIPEDTFRPYRVRLGVYGQRQPEVHMLRVKIPGGLLHADQLQALGDIAERFTPLRKGHLTTRENVQYHHMQLEGATESMRILHSAGLSTNGAGGSGVRNATACPMVGQDPLQVFDVQPYLGAYVRYFLRKDFTQSMPRKIKTAFSCGEHDCATTPIHDIGFIARVREQNGVQRKGFKVVVGGGTSIQPLKAQTLEEFVPVEDFLKLTEAVLRVYNRTDWLRKNKMKARIKVLIQTEGMEAFRNKVQAELRQEWARNFQAPDDLLFFDVEQADVPSLPSGYIQGGASDRAFQTWKTWSVSPQPTPGYSFVTVLVPQGDLSAEQWRGLGEISRRFSSHRARITPEQNLSFRWVPDVYLYDLYQALEAIGLANPGVNGITDITSCPGTDSCKLGITAPMGLNRAITAALGRPSEILEDPLIQGLHIKIGGCPSGCGRHHVADIGFHGAAMRGPTGLQVPAYELFVGGSYDGPDLRYGLRPRGKVPAKRITELVFRILRLYRDQRRDAEPFKDFAVRIGTKPFEALIAELAEVGRLSPETLDLYQDYERTGLYRLERGEGECGV